MDKVKPANKPREVFADKITTGIWHEEPSAANPYLAERCSCHGYDSLELLRKRSFFDVLYLLFRGELPSPEQASLLEALFVALINPGPRHAASRAAMNAGAGKTDPAHILPIAMAVLGGAHLGGTEVSAAMRFLRKHSAQSALDCARAVLGAATRPAAGDWHPVPGFGSRFGGVDPVLHRAAHHLCDLPGSGAALSWAAEFVAVLSEQGMGWLAPGLSAAVFVDLGFHPRAGAGLFQLVCAPGVLAHGLEFAHRPRTAWPFLDQEHYIMEPPAAHE